MMATKTSNRLESLRKRNSSESDSNLSKNISSSSKNLQNISSQNKPINTLPNISAAEVRNEYFVTKKHVKHEVIKKHKQSTERTKAQQSKQTKNPEKGQIEKNINKTVTFKEQTPLRTTSRKKKMKSKALLKIKRQDKKSVQFSISISSKQLSKSKSSVLNPTSGQSFSKRILENADVINKLSQKYKDVIQELQQKSYDCLCINSKYQSTSSKILGKLAKDIILALKNTRKFWQEVNILQKVQAACQLVYWMSRIPENYFDFNIDRWYWISFIVFAKLKPKLSQDNIHLNNLTNYCQINYDLHLINILEELQADQDTYQILNLSVKKLIPIEKRQKSIEQNLSIIKSIISVLISQHQLEEIQNCLVHEEDKETFFKQFFRLWRQQELFPLIPCSKRRNQWVLCIDLDSVILFEDNNQNICIRPYSKELISRMPQNIQIVAYSSFSQQQLQDIIQKIDPDNSIKDFVFDYSLKANSTKTAKMFNCQSSNFLLLGDFDADTNSFRIPSWHGSQYDDELLRAIYQLERKFKPFSL